MFFQGDHLALKESIEAIGASFAVFEPDKTHQFKLISCNSLYEEIIGSPVERAINQPLALIFPRYIATHFTTVFQQSSSQQRAVESEFFIDYQGQQRWWRSVSSPIVDALHGSVRIIQTCVEITEKKELEHQLSISKERYQAVVDSAYDGIITINDNHIIELMNPAAEQIFGYEPGEGQQLNLLALIPPQYRQKHPGYVDGFRQSQVDCRPMQTRAAVTGYKKDTAEFPIEVAISKIRVGDKIEMTAVIRDISEKNRLIEELLQASQEDSLIKLCNRRRFSESLTQEWSRSSRYHSPYCLIMLDLDFFKRVNDCHGHSCGDQVLIDTAQLLRQHCRQTDVLSRWGGEEFLILAPENNLKEGLQLAERVRQAIEQHTTHYDTVDLKITASLGVTCFDQTELSEEEQIRLVDKALYLAKQAGRNSVKSIESR